MANFTAIGAKKLWNFRKDQLQAAKNKGGIIGATNQNPHQQQSPNHALQLNNDIHNRDVMNIRQDFLVCLIAICMVLGTYLTSFFVDKNSKNNIAITWFFNFNTVFLARALLVPVVFFGMSGLQISFKITILIIKGLLKLSSVLTLLPQFLPQQKVWQSP